MCDLCLNFPCLDGCPNSAPDVIATCPICEHDIIEGEEVAEIGELYHVECLEELSTRELLAMFDVYTEPATA